MGNGSSIVKSIKKKIKKAKSKPIFIPKPPEPPEVIESRWKKKKDRICALSNNIQKLRLNIYKNLTSDDEKTFLTSLVVALLDKTAERIGNEDSASYGRFGVTGFKKKHINIIGNKVHLNYVGKAGVKHEKSFSDKRIAKALKKAIRRSPSNFIFETSDGFRIKADKVNKFLSDFSISAKDIRGYCCNKFTIDKLNKIEIAETEKKRKTELNKILKKIASRIGHGRSTLKKHYLIPELYETYIKSGEIINIKEEGYYKDGGAIYNKNKQAIEIKGPTWEKKTIKKLSNGGKAHKQKSIKNILKNKKILLAPNGKLSKLNEVQWNLVRTPEFKNWFGDWEKEFKIKKLLQSDNIDLRKLSPFCEIPYDKIANHNQTRKYFNSIFNNTKIINEDTKEEIFISNKGVKKILYHNASKTYHVFLSYLDSIVSKSIFITTTPLLEDKFNAINEILFYECFFIGLIDLEGNECVAYITVEKTRKYGNKLYDLTIFYKTKPELIKWTGISNPQALTNSGNSLYGKDKRLFSIYKTNPENISKVINEETTEPLPVYHGSTNIDITEFKVEKMRSDDYDAPFNGFWFSSDKKTSPAMVGPRRTYTTFLNLRHPAPSSVYKKIYEDVLDEGYLKLGKARGYGDKTRLKLMELGYDGVIWEYPPVIDEKTFEKEGKVEFTTVRGSKYWIEKNKERGGVDLYSEYSGYLTGYYNIQDLINSYDKVFVVFSPNQIKLADGTNTQFEPTNPDIRYLKGGNLNNISYHRLPKDLPMLLYQFFEDSDNDIPKEFPITKIPIDSFPKVPFTEGDRGKEYAVQMIGKNLPPVIVSNGYWLDGRHRVYAAKLEGKKFIDSIDLSQWNIYSENNHGKLKNYSMYQPTATTYEFSEDLISFLGEKSTIPAIGIEYGKKVNNGISKYVSQFGSYRYIKYIDGNPISVLQIMSKDGINGSVSNVYTKPEYRKRGYSKELWERAKQDFKTISHSEFLSESGKAFKQSVGEKFVNGGKPTKTIYSEKINKFKKNKTKYEMQNIISGNGRVGNEESIKTIPSYPRRSKSTSSLVTGTKFDKKQEEKFIRNYTGPISIKMEQEKMAEGGETTGIETQISERLKKRQEAKEFKDTGIVTYTRKYKAAYDIITSSDLEDIEKDNVTAYKLIEKSKIWPLYNVNELRDQGNSSGAAYLKVKCRESLSAKPLDKKEAREVYVKNIEKLKAGLQPLKTVAQVTKYLNDFVDLDKFDLGDISWMHQALYSYTAYIGNLAKRNRGEVEEYFNDIFGKKFYNFCKISSDSARKTFSEAILYEGYTKEQREAHIQERYDTNQESLRKWQALLENIQAAPDDEDQIKDIINKSGIRYYEYNYKKPFLIDYISKWIERLSTITKEGIDAGLSKAYTVRENDWSWSEHTEKKPTESKADEDKPRKPQNIFEKYGIEQTKVIKSVPLDFIKRTGGLAVGDVSTKSVLENFGFRNVIYGNYVNDQESKEHTRHILGAMLDLVEMCNIQIKDINKLGGLDINIGATGCGTFSPAAACYFSSLKAINITKKRGDGSLAHEWAHYLDNVLAEGSEKKATNIQWVTEGAKLKSSRVEMLFAEYQKWMLNSSAEKTIEVVFYPQKKIMYPIYAKTLEEAINSIQSRKPFYKDYKNYFVSDVYKYYGYMAYKLNNNQPLKVKMTSKATDFWINSSKYYPFDYYTDPKELFARAFAAWMEFKLKKNNRVNNYLSNIISSMGLLAIFIPREEWPFPSDADMVWLDDWFERLFSAIRVDYDINPFDWTTTERVDEYTEYKEDKNSKIEASVIISGDDVIVSGEGVEEFEKGYGFRREYIKDASDQKRIIYSLLKNPYSRGAGMAMGGERTDIFILSLKYFTEEKSGYGIAHGLIDSMPDIVKSMPDDNLEESKKEAIEYFKKKGEK